MAKPVVGSTSAVLLGWTVLRLASLSLCPEAGRLLARTNFRYLPFYPFKGEVGLEINLELTPSNFSLSAVELRDEFGGLTSRLSPPPVLVQLCLPDLLGSLLDLLLLLVPRPAPVGHVINHLGPNRTHLQQHPCQELLGCP